MQESGGAGKCKTGNEYLREEGVQLVHEGIAVQMVQHVLECTIEELKTNRRQGLRNLLHVSTMIGG